MNKEKQIEKDELFGILSNTINGANFDDLSEAVYKISDVAGYRKQSEGEWIDHSEIGTMNCSWECSCCHWTTVSFTEMKHSKYCPNCGAKMKGGAE